MSFEHEGIGILILKNKQKPLSFILEVKVFLDSVLILNNHFIRYTRLLLCGYTNWIVKLQEVYLGIQMYSR